jgi:general secretion pathway protein D
MISSLRSIKPTLLLPLLLWGLGLMGATSRIIAQQPMENLPATPSAATGDLATPSAEEGVSIQFPHTSVAEVLMTYEKLTGKRLVRDSNLAGPELSIMVADLIPRKEAISLIESSLLLNGYTIVPVDDKTVKILGPSRPPRSEGLPLYLEESQLPQDGDKIVSFYKQLNFLSPAEATAIVDGVVQRNAYGAIVQIPNASAIVITDKTPIIRKAIAILSVVDHEPSQIITEFVPLQRASAEKIVETLNQMFGGSSGGGGTAAPPQGGQGAVASASGDAHLLSGKAQFIADKRTNRVLMIVKAENYKYLRELISKLDQAVESAEPLVRPLNYLSVNDLFPVLVDMLKGKDDSDSKGSSATGSNSQANSKQNQTQNSSTGAGGGGAGGTTGASGGVSNSPDKLGEAVAQNPPQSATIGSTSVIADASGNSIIVYGPPESKAKAAQIIDLLDRRPKQVYLAAVIGQLRLTEGQEYGASWFAKINNGTSNPLIAGAVGSFTNLAVTSITNAISSFPASLTGLTVYGTIAEGIATYARALENTGKFRTISRPVVYTVNNKKATIFSGQNVPIPGQTTYNSNLSGGAVSPIASQTSTIQYQPVVLKLEVIPLINSDKEVNLTIAQHNDKLGTYSNIGGNSVPTIETQELTTTVRVPNGSTIILGGLITDDKTTDLSGLPGLFKIPVIGPLLGGSSRKSRSRSELVIMIQPIVIDSNEAMEKASVEEGADSELGKRAKNIKQKLDPTPSPTPKKKGFHLFSLPKIDNY